MDIRYFLGSGDFADEDRFAEDSQPPQEVVVGETWRVSGFMRVSWKMPSIFSSLVR